MKTLFPLQLPKGIVCGLRTDHFGLGIGCAKMFSETTDILSIVLPPF